MAEVVERVEAHGFVGRVRLYMSEVVAEMRRVTWPDKAQIRQLAIGVVVLSLVIGAVIGVNWNLFQPGYTLASILANTYQGGTSSGLELSSLIYCALILLVFSILVNLLAQFIVRRSGRRLAGQTR